MKCQLLAISLLTKTGNSFSFTIFVFSVEDQILDTFYDKICSTN